MKWSARHSKSLQIEASALAQMKELPKQLGVRVQREDALALKHNTCVTGRQIAHVVYDWFRTDRHVSQVFGFADLTDIQWKEDKPREMQDFLGLWDHILENIEPPVTEPVLGSDIGRGAKRPCFGLPFFRIFRNGHARV